MSNRILTERSRSWPPVRRAVTCEPAAQTRRSWASPAERPHRGATEAF